MLKRIDKKQAVKDLAKKINIFNHIFDLTESFIEDGSINSISVMENHNSVQIRLDNPEKLAGIVEALSPDPIPSRIKDLDDVYPVSPITLQILYDRMTINPIFHVKFFKKGMMISIYFLGLEFYCELLKMDYCLPKHLMESGVDVKRIKEEKQDWAKHFFLEGLKVQHQLGGNSIHYCSDADDIERFENIVLKGSSQIVNI